MTQQTFPDIMTTRFLVLSVMLLLTALPNASFGQAGVIKLTNPSFEDYPLPGRVPASWRDCGFSGESPPDTHPSGEFDVVKYPSHGNTYLGMVVRDNDTWERVSQQLSAPIKRGTCYSFSLNLCRSELYVSASRRTNVRANYVDPIKLVIWGGDGHCSKKELLAESPLVKNTTWQPYAFKFEPKQTHSHITLEAFYETPVLFPYNGNVLVDNASDIVPMPCDEEPIIAKMPEVQVLNPAGNQPKTINTNRYTVAATVKNIDKKSALRFILNGQPNSDFTFNPRTGQISAKAKRLKAGKNIVLIEATNKAGTTADGAVLIYEPPLVAYEEPPSRPQSYEAPPKAPVLPPATPAKKPQKEKKIEGFARNEISKGQIIKLNALSFKMNDATLNPSNHDRLDEVYEFLKAHEEVVIEIGGHTSGLCDDVFCNKLSKDRAKSVADYLNGKGIPMRQLSYKGYGKTKPIASNNTTGGRRKNQRVEIKILSTDG
ncbi:MAG: OmpA family protein [Bacteroidota bacterium]